MTKYCPVCDQKFYSENSYHVHMESNHRDYRGKDSDELSDELL